MFAELWKFNTSMRRAEGCEGAVGEEAGKQPYKQVTEFGLVIPHTPSMASYRNPRANSVK